MKPSRPIAAIAVREAKGFLGRAAMRTGHRTADSTRTPPSFRALNADETEALVGAELLAALFGALPRA